jgi:serine protease Do
MSRKSSVRLATAAAATTFIVIVGVIFWPDLELRPRDFAHPAEAQSNASSGRSVAEQMSEAFEAASNKVSPSVVPIYAEKKVEVSEEMSELYRRFYGQEMPEDSEGNSTQTLRSVGSGVVARSGGYILTNNHVVADATKLTVILEDGKRHEAKVVGTDPPTDLAVIKVDAKELPVATFGSSQGLRVGQWVIAVGNPFQLLHSVTAGIVSAKGRSSIGVAAYEDFIQTDASINPGNSGGALADLDGKVVGINTAIASNSGVGAGVGFAIPIDMAKQIMDELINSGGVTRGYLAILPQDITEDLAQALKVPENGGALVGSVTSGGPGEKGGIKRGDVIIEFNGQKITNSNQLRNEVARMDPDKTANVVVIRDGKRKELKVKVGERPTETSLNTPAKQPKQPPDKLQEDFGLAVGDLTPDAAEQLGYNNARGALVVGVRGGSPADNAGFAKGDLIMEIDRKPVVSARDVDRMLANVTGTRSVAVLVRRGDNTFYVPLSKG